MQDPAGSAPRSDSRSIAITTFGNVLTPLAALGTQPILAHGLGLQGRGEVAAATAPLLFAVIVMTLGLPEALTYFVARRSVGLGRARRLSLALLILAGLLGTGAIALLAVPLSGGDADLAQLMIVAGFALMPGLAVAGLRGLAAGRQMWMLIALERLIGAAIQLTAVALLFAYGALSVLTATISIAVTTFIGGSVYVFAIGTMPGDLMKVSKAERPRILNYAGQVWLGSVTGIALARLDQLLMTPLAGVAELGLYAVAVSISEVILVFNSAVRDVMFAVESGAPDPRRLGQASRTSTLITLVLGLGLAAACPWAIPLLFGREFDDAVLITFILIGAIILGNPGSVAGAGLSARGKPGLRSLALAIAAVINVVAVFFLVPVYGAVGAAIATLIGRVVAGTALIVFLRVAFGIPMSEFYGLRSTDIRDFRAQISQFAARLSSGRGKHRAPQSFNRRSR